MSKHSRRIEKASPAMASGAFGVGLFKGATNENAEVPQSTQDQSQATPIPANAPVIRLTR